MYATLGPTKMMLQSLEHTPWQLSTLKSFSVQGRVQFEMIKRSLFIRMKTIFHLKKKKTCSLRLSSVGCVVPEHIQTHQKEITLKS